jgi:hypothetical protein
MFISHYNNDVMLISETHFTDKSYLELPKYTVSHTNHPAGTARGGTAIIIKPTIKHHLQSSYKQDFRQAVFGGIRNPNYFGSLSPTQTCNKIRVTRRIIQDSWTLFHDKHIINTLTVNPELPHPEDGKYSKQWKKQLKTSILGRIHILTI